jgi:outer membrane protein TolC
MRCLFILVIIFLALVTQSFAVQKNDPDAPIYLAARTNYLKTVDKGPEPASVDSLTSQLAARADTELLVHKNLSLNEMLQQVVKLNQRVLMQKTEWGIKQAEKEKAHAIFEPDFIASFELADNSQKNTVEESLSRSFAPTYEERNWDYSAAIEGFAPTGAKYNLGFNLRELTNSVTESLTGEDNEWQVYLGFSLTQPLLKNAGFEVTRAGIHAAEAESEAAFHEYRQEMMQTVNMASVSYWEFYQAQEKLRLRQQSILIAGKILADNRERHRTGKMAETEVYEAMAGVASRNSLLSEADQEHLEAANKLRDVLSIESSESKLEIKASEVPIVDKKAFNKGTILEKAFQLQPEYLATKAQLMKSDIKLAFAKNQRLPELDLIASYGLNGLDFRFRGAGRQIKDAEFDSWAVGMEFRVPLLGGIDSRAELKKSHLEKRRQLLALKDIEIKLTNNVDTAINKVSSAVEQLEFAEEIVAIQKKLLDAELVRLQSGKSNSRLVLEKEDDYRNALEIELKNRVKLQTALVELEQAGGTILLSNGVEIMER